MELLWQRLEGRSGHEAGRGLLAKLCGEPLPEIVLSKTGKPRFVTGAPHFSISHTKNHVFCCISSKNIGLDAEEQGRSIDPRLAERYFSPGEAARCAAAENPGDALLRLWVLKEAEAKRTGRGWGNYLRETDFDPADPRILSIDGCFVAILEDE